MPLTDDFDDDDFPVLENVVKVGNTALIDAVRATHKAAQPEKRETAAPTPAALSRSITAPQSAAPRLSKPTGNPGSDQKISTAQLEILIDEIVERHAIEMRSELRTILRHRG